MPTKRRTADEKEKLCTQVFERIATGDKGLRAICEELKLRPGTLLEWLDKSPELAERYARAKRLQAELLAAEIVAISDEAEVEAVYMGEKMKLDLSSNAIARNRLRIDARKWVAAKLLPKVYGDKLAVGGAEDLPPIQQNVTLDPAEAYKRLLGGSGG